MNNNQKQEATTISNPRLLSAIYFGLLTIIVTILIDTVIYALGKEQLLPIFQGILLGVIIAAIFGALFGEAIVHSKKPYRMRVFWLAFAMVLLALPVYDLGFLILFKYHHGALLADTTLMQLLYLYLMILFYSFMLVGLWLAIFAGFAAIFLRGKLVNYLLRTSRYEKRKAPKEKVVQNKTPKYGQATVTVPEEKNNK